VQTFQALESGGSGGLAGRTGAITVRPEGKIAGVAGVIQGISISTIYGRKAAGGCQYNFTGKTGYASSLRIVAYKHIPTQTLFPAAEAKLVKLDVKVKSKNIGYIAGAGDEVPAALQQIGCLVTPLGAPRNNR
jgi:hypothetical protein